MKIRTLGLYQPYAGLMLHGKVETRWVGFGRKPPFPLGLYLIYSTIRSCDDGKVREISGPEFFSKICELHGKHEDDFHRFGQALCLGTLTKIVDHWTPSEENFEKGFVKYEQHPTHIRVGLVFDEVRRIEPFAFKGKQGIGFLSAEDEAKIEFI